MQRKKFWISFPSTTVVACLLCAWALLGLLGVQRGSPCPPGPQVRRKGGGIMWGGRPRGERLAVVVGCSGQKRPFRGAGGASG